MPEAPFSSDDYADAEFEALDAKGLALGERHFEACTFRRCHLQGAALAKTRIVGGAFVHCDLSNLEVRGATLRDVRFSGCKLIGVNWALASTIAQLEFEDCVMDFASFVGVDLRKCVFRACRLREADFAHANLSGADCRGSDFTAARFSSTNLSGADFRQALNYAIRPDDNKLTKARFSLPEATLLLYGLGIEIEE